MKIEIKSIPQNEQRFTTQGDWWEDEDSETLQIRVTEMDNLKYWFTVLVHELVEICFCRILGVTTWQADEFDMTWERELSNGLHNLTDEAGEDSRCPYRVGHMAGEKAELIMSLLLGFDFDEYCEYCDNLIKWT